MLVALVIRQFFAYEVIGGQRTCRLSIGHFANNNRHTGMAETTACLKAMVASNNFVDARV